MTNATMMPLSELKLDFEPKYLLEYSIAKKSVVKNGIVIPFPVVVRNGDYYVKGRELYFLICQELQVSEVPVSILADERLYDRQMIAASIGPSDNPIDMAWRIRKYQERYSLTQNELGREFEVSQSIISRYFRIIDYLYPETVEVYHTSLKVADITRNHRENPSSRMGAVDVGFRHLYELTELHEKYSGFSEHRARTKQSQLMDQITTKCPSVVSLKKKIKEITKRKHNSTHNAVDIPRIKVYNADSRYLLNVIPKESVHLVLTSPPYNLGKPYETTRSMRDHLQNIIPPLQSAACTLVCGGWMIVNIVDYKIGYGEFLPIRDLLIYAIMSCDMRFISPTIWAKKIIKQLDCRNELRVHSNYSIMPNMEYLLMFRKNGKRPIDTELAELSKAMIRNDETQNEWRNFSAVMHFNSEYGGNDLEGIGNAVMPNMLADFLVRGFSLIGDTVLDPFAGTGTTLLHAEANKRNGIGFERSQIVFDNYLSSYSAKEEVPQSRVDLPRQWEDMMKIAMSCIPVDSSSDNVSGESLLDTLTAS